MIVLMSNIFRILRDLFCHCQDDWGVKSCELSHFAVCSKERRGVVGEIHYIGGHKIIILLTITFFIFVCAGRVPDPTALFPPDLFLYICKFSRQRAPIVF
jgi:hypothetical protein